MKRPAIILLSLLLAGGAGGYGYYYYNIRDVRTTANTDASRVFASRVSDLTAHSDSSGKLQRYGGEVEPMTMINISKESDQEIRKTYVEVGDHVSVGTKLFSYDPTSIENNIEKNEIELEETQISIARNQRELEYQRKVLNAAKTESDRMDAELSISSLENSIKSSEYDVKKKELERERLQKNLENTDVRSEVDGVIRSIKAGTDSDDYSDTYMTIMVDGDFRIKAKINEQNISEVELGDRMVIYSRLNEGAVFYGTVTGLDTSQTETTQTGNSYFYTSDTTNSATSSTNYSFFVTLDSSEGLLLGEHVYLEKDEGQLNPREGIWLFSGYLTEQEDGIYVWAESARHTLELRKVTTGEYDALLDRYEITEGLSMDDYVVYPLNYLETNMVVTRVSYGGDDRDTEEDMTELRP